MTNQTAMIIILGAFALITVTADWLDKGTNDSYYMNLWKHIIGWTFAAVFFVEVIG